MNEIKMSDTVARQIYSLSLIPRYPRSVSTSYIQDELNSVGFNAPIRMVQRDLDSLSLRWPLICDDQTKPYRWSWVKEAQGMIFPVMDPVEALTIALAEQHLKSLLPTSSYQKVETYFDLAKKTLSSKDQKKLKNWIRKVRVFPRGQPLEPARIIKAVENVIYEALLNDSKIRAKYRKRYAKSSSEYLINPLGLVVRNAVTYLICSVDHDPENPRFLPLHRFTRATDLQEPATAPKGFNFDDFLASNPLGFLMSDKLLNIELLFDYKAGFHLTETPMNSSQRIIETVDGKLKIKAKVEDTSELRFWISGFAQNVEVLKPRSLRKEFQKRSEQLLKLYK